MQDYKKSIKSELDECDKKRERLLTALSVLADVDSKSIQNKTLSLQPKATGRTLKDNILSILRDQSMATNDVVAYVALEREVSGPSVATALYRMRKSGKITKEGKLWSVVEPTSSTEQQQQP